MLRKLDWLFMPTPSAALFALRTSVAALVALYLSMSLQLEEPRWAMLTVFIVAQPLSGMVLAKGAARFAGTMVAASAAIVLIGLFGQTPVLFAGALALWVALCVFFATFLRNFRSYAFVLAGYTAAIIAVPATQAPTTIFTLAVTRGMEIGLGIVCAGLSSLLFAPQAAGRAYFKNLNALFTSIGTYLAGLTGQEPEQAPGRARAMMSSVLQLETLRGYARYDTPGFRARNRLARRMNYELMSLLTAAFTVQEYLRRRTPQERPLPGHEDASAELRPVVRELTQASPPFPDSLKKTLSRAYDAILQHARKPGRNRSPDEWVALSRLLDLANRLRAAVVMLELLHSESEPRRQPQPVSFSTEVDVRMALRNAGRAFIAVAFTATVWFETASSSGLIALILVSVFTTLFATRDNPVAATVPFAQGVACAAVAGFLYSFFCLPAINGFPLMAMTLFPLLFAGSLAMANPSTAGPGTGFLVLLSILLSPSNSIRPQADTYLNNALGMALALTVVLLSFLLLWPSGPRSTVRRLLDGMFADLASGFTGTRHLFESRMYDRLVRLLPHLSQSRPQDELVLQGALGAITLGIEARGLSARLRNSMMPDEFRRQGERLLARIAEFCAGSSGRHADLESLVEQVEELGHALLSQADPMEDRRLRRLLVRAGVTAHIIGSALESNATFFLTQGRPSEDEAEEWAHAV